MKTNFKIAITATFSVILLLTSLLISSGVSAADFFSMGSKKFDANTYVGPFNISHMKSKKAKSKLTSDLTELQSNIDVNYHYQDYSFEVPAEVFTFDVNATIDHAQSGEDNPIIVHVSRDGLATVLKQELPFISFSEESVEAVATGTEKDLETGIMPRNIYITDYLHSNTMPIEKVASSVYSIDGISTSFLKALGALDGQVVQPFQTVSLAELFNTTEIGSLTEDESTILASIVYSAILQTNFTIDERNISSSLSSGIQPGFEAAMDTSSGMDFIFTNPNKSSFTLSAEWITGKIHFSIEGQPFYYVYEPNVLDVEKYEPRTVVRYSAFVNKGQVIVESDGVVGVSAVVHRTKSHEGQVIEDEKIASDFYAPLSKIELHSLEKEESGQSTNSNNSAVLDAGQPGEDSTQNPFNPTEDDDTNQVDQENKVNKSPNNGTSNEIKEEKQEYDKSGLPLTGK